MGNAGGGRKEKKGPTWNWIPLKILSKMLVKIDFFLFLFRHELSLSNLTSLKKQKALVSSGLYKKTENALISTVCELSHSRTLQGSNSLIPQVEASNQQARTLWSSPLSSSVF